MAAEYDLQIDQGATFRHTFQWEAGEPPTPVDLTGCTALLHIRARMRDVSPVLVASTANGKLIIAGPGSVTIHLTPFDTGLLQTHEGVYDLEITFSNGDVTRLVGGKVYVSLQVTR